MSKSTFGWRQAGFTAVATALVFGGTLVGVGAANAAAAATLTITPGQTKTAVHQGDTGNNAVAVSGLTYSTDNLFANGSTVSFRIAGNVCTTAADREKAIGFVAGSEVSVTVAGSASPAPTASDPAALTKSDPACDDFDIATVTLTNPTTPGDPLDRVDLVLDNIVYNVGDKAPLGDVTVNATGTGGLGNASAANAVVAGTTLSIDGVTAASPGTTNVALGTVKLAENVAGNSFALQTDTAPRSKTVNVSLAGDNGNDTVFNTDALATVTPSAGYTITNRSYDTDKTGFNFTVNTTADNDTDPLTNPQAAATITISGIRVDTDTNNNDNAEQVSVLTNLDTDNVTVDTLPGKVKALNVMSYNVRQGGGDRYATAAKLFGSQFDAGTLRNPADVVLSSGQNFPDALSASYLAGKENTGILLTKKDTLSPAAYNAIIAQKVGTVYLTGGLNAVSQAVENKLEATRVGGSPFGAMIQVVRVFGDDRYETNRAINESQSSNSDTVLVATGEDFPDALGLGPIAFGGDANIANDGFPLVLTKGASLSPDASAQLDSMDPVRVVIAGGTDVVSQSVADAIAAKDITVLRVEGEDRTDTAAQVAQWATEGLKKDDGTAVAGFLGIGLDFELDATQLATGSDFADALAAGPYAGNQKEIILLSRNSDNLGTGAVTYLGAKDVLEIINIEGLGLQNALASAVLKAAAVSVQK